MDQLSYGLDFLDTSLKEGNLICNTALPHLVDSKSKVRNSWKGYTAEEIAVRVYNETVLRGRRRV